MNDFRHRYRREIMWYEKRQLPWRTSVELRSGCVYIRCGPSIRLTAPLHAVIFIVLSFRRGEAINSRSGNRGNDQSWRPIVAEGCAANEGRGRSEGGRRRHQRGSTERGSGTGVRETAENSAIFFFLAISPVENVVIEG